MNWNPLLSARAAVAGGLTVLLAIWVMTREAGINIETAVTGTGILLIIIMLLLGVDIRRRHRDDDDRGGGN